MMLFRVIAMCMGLIIFAPMIALNVWGIQMSGYVNDVMAAQSAAENNQEDFVMPAMPVTPLSWWYDRKDLRDTFSTDDINMRRTVTVREIVAFEDLLAPGEAAPSDDLIPLYIAARAPARMMPYCAEVIATIGAACDMTNASGRRARSGKYELTATLPYVPAADLGNPQDIPGAEKIQMTVAFPKGDGLFPANDAENRAALMRRAQAACDALRDRYGTCVLTYLDLDVEELWITDLEALPAGTNPERLEAAMGVTVYANPAELSRETLRETLVSLLTQG